MDRHNTQLEKDLKAAQQQLINVQKCLNDKQVEIQNLNSTISDQKLMHEAATFRINKLEQTNRLLTQSLTSTEQSCSELESQLGELRGIYNQTEENLSELQSKYKTTQTCLQNCEKEIELFTRKLDDALSKNQELNVDNSELRETIKYLQQQLQEKIIQEEQNIREKQSNSNFKDFVQVRRTLQTCQHENEQLKVELKKLQLKLLSKNE